MSFTERDAKMERLWSDFDRKEQEFIEEFLFSYSRDERMDAWSSKKFRKELWDYVYLYLDGRVF